MTLSRLPHPLGSQQFFVGFARRHGRHDIVAGTLFFRSRLSLLVFAIVAAGSFLALSRGGFKGFGKASLAGSFLQSPPFLSKVLQAQRLTFVELTF